jgi:hypothetical protein
MNPHLTNPSAAPRHPDGHSFMRQRPTTPPHHAGISDESTRVLCVLVKVGYQHAAVIEVERARAFTSAAPGDDMPLWALTSGLQAA